MAHELGHNLGMQHDVASKLNSSLIQRQGPELIIAQLIERYFFVDCECPSTGGCIMSAYVRLVHPGGILYLFHILF